MKQLVNILCAAACPASMGGLSIATAQGAADPRLEGTRLLTTGRYAG
jgi:hypothetical protein